VVELIQRLYDPDQGAVLLDGVDVRELDSDWLRENVAVVHQEPVMLGMTIAQNIAFALDSATQAQVEAAARFANVHDLIQSIPDGYQARIGDTGVRLTGPQRLQVGLARALLAPSKILILDETLSGLDEQSVMVVLSNLRREMGGTRTVIATTSMPQTLRGAFETIAVLQEGRIAPGGVGSHQHLAANSAEYRRLLDPAAAQYVEASSSSGSALQQQTSTMSSVDGEAVWRRRLQLVDDLEDNILQLGMQQGQVMQMVEVVTEIKEALALEASSSSLR